MEENFLPQVFKHEEFGEVRVIMKDGVPLFCLADVCRVLELPQVAKVVQRLDKGVLSTHPVETAGGVQQMYFVNEDGLYDVILDSRKPNAKIFRKWITGEVLPKIFRTGSYSLPGVVNNETLAVEREKIAVEREKISVEREKIAVEHEKIAVEQKKLAVERDDFAKAQLLRELASATKNDVIRFNLIRYAAKLVTGRDFDSNKYDDDDTGLIPPPC